MYMIACPWDAERKGCSRFLEARIPNGAGVYALPGGRTVMASDGCDAHLVGQRARRTKDGEFAENLCCSCSFASSQRLSFLLLWIFSNCSC